MLANLVNRVLALVLLFASVGWTVPYLGPERFGLWMMIASFTALLTFLDLGIGNALTNRVAQAATSNHRQILQNVISGGLTLLFVMSILIAIILLTIVNFVPWSDLFNIHDTNLAIEAQETLQVFSILFALNIFASGISRVFHGLQRGFETHSAQAIGLFIGLIALYLASDNQSSLPILLTCSMGGAIIGNLALLPVLFTRRQVSHSGVKVGIQSEPKYLLKIGSLFFLLQIGTMVGWGIDHSIIAATIGPTAVAAYAVTQRLMQLVTVPLTIINAPLWPAYADAYARHDKSFIRKTLLSSLTITATYAALIATLLVFFGKTIIYYWTSGTIHVSIALIIAFASWAIFDAIGNACAMFLNGTSIVREQTYIVCTFVLIALPLKIVLAEPYGAVGVILAGLIVYILVTLTGYGFIFRKTIQNRISI